MALSDNDKETVKEIIELNNEVKLDSKEFKPFHLLSINETKTSTLIIVLLLLIGISVFQIIAMGDISTNLTDLTKVALLSVAGASGMNAIGNKGGY